MDILQKPYRLGIIFCYGREKNLTSYITIKYDEKTIYPLHTGKIYSEIYYIKLGSLKCKVETKNLRAGKH